MKVIIAGGRNIHPTTDEVGDAIRDSGFPAHEIVHGGATGVDAAGKAWAMRNGVPVTLFRAEWNRYGRAAGPLRNKEMADYADALILIWNGKSRGSASMKREAEARGLPIHEVLVP